MKQPFKNVQVKNANESILRKFSFYFCPHFFNFLKVSNKIAVNLYFFSFCPVNTIIDL